MKQLNAVPENKRGYVDETGFNEPLIREYAYGNKGERVLGERTGKRSGFKTEEKRGSDGIYGVLRYQRGTDFG